MHLKNKAQMSGLIESHVVLVSRPNTLEIHFHTYKQHFKFYHVISVSYIQCSSCKPKLYTSVFSHYNINQTKNKLGIALDSSWYLN